MKYRIRKKPAGPYYESEYSYIVEYKKWYRLRWKEHRTYGDELMAKDELTRLKNRRAKEKEQHRIHKMSGEVIYEESDRS